MRLHKPTNIAGYVVREGAIINFKQTGPATITVTTANDDFSSPQIFVQSESGIAKWFSNAELTELIAAGQVTIPTGRDSCPVVVLSPAQQARVVGALRSI